MSRRRRATKRKAIPDPKYNSVVISKFINRVMLDGKKSLATKIVYGALEEFTRKVNSEDAMAAFDQAMENAMPTLEVKSRRIGGADSTRSQTSNGNEMDHLECSQQSGP